MTDSTKRKTLILLGLVMLITVIIAASLPQLELQPGMPLPRVENGQVVLAPIEEEPLVVISVNEFFKVLFALILAGSILYVIYRMIRGSRLEESWILYPANHGRQLNCRHHHFPDHAAAEDAEYLSNGTAPSNRNAAVTSPLGPVPALLFWLVGIGLLVSSILLGIWIFAPSSRRETTIDLVGLEAENALQSLKTGLDLKDVIVKCYRQMSLALEKEQGIERKDSMTTREFENLLEAAGMPHDPIHQLTQLFEAVRYGNWQPNPMDEQKAIHCLEAIMLFSRETKKTH